MTKLEYAVHLTAAIGYLITKQQDAVGLGVIGDGLNSFIPAAGRRTHLAHLLSELANIEPSGRTGLASGIEAALRRIPHRGLVILMSDLLTDSDAVAEALSQIRFRGHDLIVMHVLDAMEVTFDARGAVKLVDPESGASLTIRADSARERYDRAVADWRRDLEGRIGTLRADYVPLDTAMPFDKALIEFLVQRSRRI
jgi:uncharacterized protein (DUF58 family)